MSASLARLAATPQGAVIWCGGARCTHPPVYVPPEELLPRFGNRTCEEAQRLLRCSACGATGREGKVTLLPSTMDEADRRMGYPPGTSERRAAAQRDELEQIDRAWYAANGWRWPRP